MKDFHQLVQNIHDWHKQHRQEHFFRQNRTPYRVWISEVALQQTRIAAAAPRLKSFLETFPDLESLAKAPEEKVVQAFSGLGYYNRARNLARGAAYFLEKHGKLPESYEELLQGPSVGPYTAAAIASICFGEKRGVIDGNVRRIIARLFTLKTPPGEKSFESACEAFMERYIHSLELDPGFLNEALMELGQQICTVKTPQCIACPVSSHCGAHSNPLAYPIAKKKPEKIEVDWHALIITNPARELLIQKYSSFRFLKEMWGFPSALTIREGKTEQKEYSAPGLAEERIAWHTFEKGPRHTITRHKIQFHTKMLSASELKPIHSGDIEWVSLKEAKKRLVSSAMMKVLKIAAERNG